MTPPSASTIGSRMRRLKRVRVPALPSLPRHTGRWLLGLLVLALALAIAYQFWFRDSSFVKVEQVRISGATSADAERLRTTLTSVARSMTTLDVDRRALEQAVQGYPVVRGLEVDADFPHTLRIRVLEHVPAAVALVGDARVPVAGDGTVLRGVSPGGSLPTLHAKGIEGDRLAGAIALGAARVAGAAPLPLRRRLEDVTRDSERGLVAHLKDGPELVFGNSRRVRAKWIAAARVLADGDAQGATYIDVRLPSRPAVGGLGAASVEPVAPAAAATSLPTQPTAPEAATTPPATAAQSPAIDPATGATIDPATGAPIDPATGAPVTQQATPAVPTTTDPSAVSNTQP